MCLRGEISFCHLHDVTPTNHHSTSPPSTIAGFNNFTSSPHAPKVKMPVVTNQILKGPVFGDLNALAKFTILVARPGHIYLATYNALNNAFAIQHDLAFEGNPSWLALDADKKHLYAVDESSTQLHRFKFDPSAAEPFTEKTSTEASEGLVYLEFNEKQTQLIAAAFSASAVDIFDLKDALTRVTKIVSDGKTGPITHIQDAPHPHQVVRDPTGRFYVVPDLGTDQLLVVDSQDDKFSIANRIALEPGSGPRHGAFYPVGAEKATHFILLCELSNTVKVFALDYKGDSIEFSQVSSASTFGAEETPKTARAGAFELLPDNENIYVTNRLTGRESDSIAHLRLEAQDGAPAVHFVKEVATNGVLPRHLSIFHRGNGDVLVGNETGEDGLLVFKRDRESGELDETPTLGVKMSQFMSGEELKATPGNGPKFVLPI